MNPLPPWVIFHIPHDSVCIPVAVREQFTLNDQALRQEIVEMTDHCTLDLFATNVPAEQIVRAPVSRLVVDVERFGDDSLEPMAALGMGVVYGSTSRGAALRHPISPIQRQSLIDHWYHPHHRRLTMAVDRALGQWGRALVLDAHSFPSIPLPYELDRRLPRPQVCLGTDAFHTAKSLEMAMESAFESLGFSTAINNPFSGALVPMQFYQRDCRVAAVMVEINRALYLDELSGRPSNSFTDVSQQIRSALSTAIDSWSGESPCTTGYGKTTG